MEGGSWKSGLIGLVLILAFLVCGIEFGGGSEKPAKVQLTCTTYGHGQYNCESR